MARRQRRCYAVFKSSSHQPTCLPHTVEASQCPFYCWTSSNKAFNINVCILWVEITANQIRVISAVSGTSAIWFNTRWRQILWKKSEPNHQRIADDWFCNYQSLFTHQLGRICRSNLSKQWKGEVTKRTLAEAQRPHGTAWLLAIYPNTNLRLASEWLNGA